MGLNRLALLAVAAVMVVAGCGGNSGGQPRSFVVVRQDNPTVPGTSVFTELVRLQLEPGQYQVSGKVELHNRDAAVPLRVQCALVPGKADGTAGQPDDLGTDWGFLTLERSGEAGEQGAIVLFVSQELENTGSVSLGCDGSGSEHGAFGAYMTIRAIEVGSIAAENATP
jgi:hypothetical protein